MTTLADARKAMQAALDIINTDVPSLDDADPDNNLPTSADARVVPVTDSLNRTQAEDTALKERKDQIDAPYQKGVKSITDSVGGGGKKPDATDRQPAQASRRVSVGMYKFNYTATPRPGFEGKDGPVLLKTLVLEEGVNKNGWMVDPKEFETVAAQYKAGRHLRINHSKDVQDVIGKSYDSKVIKGKDVQSYLGVENPLEGINPDGLYVTADFEANPRNQQVRTNILHGYVDTGSLGIDANAFCAQCDKPLVMNEDGTSSRSCVHLDAAVILRDIEVKEYSYVAEPAFDNTKAFPTFSAAVSSIFPNKGSSLSQTKTTSTSDMSATVTEPTKQAKVEATAAVTGAKAAKADADGESEADARAQAYADAILKAYKSGQSDMQKFRADSDSDSDSDSDNKKKADASASVTAAKIVTDQVGVSAQTAKATPTKQENILQAAWHPTAYAMKDPMIQEIFKAAVEAPDAPASVRRFKGARWD